MEPESSAGSAEDGKARKGEGNAQGGMAKVEDSDSGGMEGTEGLEGKLQRAEWQVALLEKELAYSTGT